MSWRIRDTYAEMIALPGSEKQYYLVKNDEDKSLLNTAYRFDS
jgi:hypothetical protein